MSPSSRRAWIEIDLKPCVFDGLGVALLAEGVDRNIVWRGIRADSLVALLAEGVDRNQCSVMGLPHLQVALLAEGVDRNKLKLISTSRPVSRPPRGGRG